MTAVICFSGKWCLYFHSYILHIYNILQRVRELYMMLFARDVYVMNYKFHDMNKNNIECYQYIICTM
jgi:hypothetical protein